MVALVLSVAVTGLEAASAGAVGTVGAVGGGAFGESVHVNTLLSGLVTSGPLPSVTLPATGGGPFTASVLNVNVPNLLSAQTLSVSTQGLLGTGGFATSSSTTQGANVAGGALTAGVIQTTCRINNLGITSGSTFTDLKVLGVPVPLNQPPNSSIPIVGVGTLIFNEQLGSSGPGGLRTKTVNGVHLVLNGLLGTGDIIVSQSACVAKV